MTWPIQTTDVTAHLGVTPAGDPDQVALDRATQAAVAWVTETLGLPSAPVDGDPGPGPAIELGTVMLAARWYSRRSSTQGVAAFGDLGPAYVTRTDPDVAQLLGLNRPWVQ